MNDHNGVRIVLRNSANQRISIMPRRQILAIALVAVDSNIVFAAVAVNEYNCGVLELGCGAGRGRSKVVEVPRDGGVVFDSLRLDRFERL